LPLAGPTAALHQFVTLLDGMSDLRRIEAAEAFLHVCREITGRKSRDAFTALELAASVTVDGFSGSVH
jgi:hypothetical protein